MEKKYVVGIGILIVALIFVVSMYLPFPANIIMMLGCFLIIMKGKYILLEITKEE